MSQALGADGTCREESQVLDVLWGPAVQLNVDVVVFCLFTCLTSVYAALQKKEEYSRGLQNLLLNVLRNNTMCGITSREIKQRPKIEFLFAFFLRNKQKKS